MGRDQGTTGTEDDDAPIEALDLSVRTYNYLKRKNITTVRQVLSRTKEDLIGVSSFSLTPYKELRERLIARGFLSPTHLIGPFAEEEGDRDGGS